MKGENISKMILNQEMLYKDITDELIKMATPNDNPIPELSRYLKYNLKNASFDMKDITDIERIKYQVQYRNILSVSILAKISPRGRHTMIRIAEANQEADASKDMMPRL